MKFNHPLRSLLVPFVSLAMLVSGIQAGDAKEGMDSRRSLPRLVDLGADKCIPCKMMAPILADLSPPRHPPPGRIAQRHPDLGGGDF